MSTDTTLGDYIARLARRDIMNKNIAELVAAAGFSNTFELERLTILTKLIVTHCITVYENERSLETAKQLLQTQFNIK